MQRYKDGKNDTEMFHLPFSTWKTHKILRGLEMKVRRKKRRTFRQNEVFGSLKIESDIAWSFGREGLDVAFGETSEAILAGSSSKRLGNDEVLRDRAEVREMGGVKGVVPLLHNEEDSDIIADKATVAFGREHRSHVEDH